MQDLTTEKAQGAEGGFQVTLPPEARAIVEAAYAEADVVLEYGSGGSSFIALGSDVRRLFTVESDAAWAAEIETQLRAAFPSADPVVHLVDIGPTRAWGRTRGTSGFQRYHLYPNSVWDLDGFEHPDVVLIDGRFRVACFLTTLFRCARPVRVLFDDYAKRRHYHQVETFAEPVRVHGRMAEFRLEPRAVPAERLTEIIATYADQR